MTGHLLQVGGAYLVNASFHALYIKYAHNGEEYLESEYFRFIYPGISLKQARLDSTNLYGMLLSINKKDRERIFILKYEASQDRIMVWIEFFKENDNNKEKS